MGQTPPRHTYRHGYPYGHLHPTDTPVPLPLSWTGKKYYTFDAMWGSKGSGLGQLNFPEGIAVGPSENIYICDTGNNRILVWDNEGRPLRTIGSFGSSATWRNPPQFDHPSGSLSYPTASFT